MDFNEQNCDLLNGGTLSLVSPKANCSEIEPFLGAKFGHLEPHLALLLGTIAWLKPSRTVVKS